ncbi:MAG: gliding motility-associated C-terminal domain-containing protein, partial [Flavobacteriales bacterium]|nr:gliding motility-associated C-terminal domain-containing protein [Flavobacteriales bacterium]
VAPCVDATATITVTENAAPDAGTNGTLDVCGTSAASSLFAQLGGTPDAGGAWSGPSAVVGGQYDPATMAPGVYTYTVAGVAPCVDATATITVTENAAPDAGLDGALTACDQGAAQGLFAQLGGTPDAGGSWMDPNGVAHSGSFDPSTDPAGNYTYTLAAAAPCPGDQSVVNVTLTGQPDAGVDGALTLCESSAATNLFTELGGTPDAGGSWTDPNGVAHSGSFDPSTDPAGNYTYTLAAAAPCPGDQSVVNVTLTGQPDAGVDGALTLCESSAATSLFAELGGTPDAGGAWTDPNGVAHSGNFDPSTDPAGNYTYTLAALPPCVSATSIVAVSVEIPPDPGSGSSVDVCAGAPSFDLYAQLGGSPDLGGVWTDPNGNVFNGIFDPSLSLGGVQTYTVQGSSCPDASSTVQVSLLPGPNAGADNTIALCSDDSPIQLLDSLGGAPDPGGAWTDPNGDPFGNVLDPATALAGPYTYLVIGNGTCPDDASVLTIAVSQAVSAGTAGALTLCSDHASIDLFNALSGSPQPGGVWTDPFGNAVSSTFDPAADDAGVYTYTLPAVGACLGASSAVNVEVELAPDAGDNALATLCSNDGQVDLFSLLAGSPVSNGNWYDEQGNPFSGVFDPATGSTGEYMYVVNAVIPCVNDTALLEVTVVNAPDAGIDASFVACSSASSTDLSTLLGSTSNPGGSWFAPNGAVFSGIVHPPTDPSGTYQYVVEGAAPCGSDTAAVQVTIIQEPDAVIAADVVGGCVPLEVVFSSSYQGPGDFVWTFGNGDTSFVAAPDTVLFDAPGIYDIGLIINPGNGCADTVLVAGLVQAFEAPVAGLFAAPQQVTTLAPQVYFQNLTVGADQFQWTFADLGTSSLAEPVFAFPTEISGEYEVCLVATVAGSCSDTVCTTIVVDDALEVHVPNAFTPNADGINDDFRPVLLGIDPDRYSFSIFDRWGQEQFNTDDPFQAWNGLFANGEEAPQGVYVWKLNAKDPYSGARIERVGHVTLLR